MEFRSIILTTLTILWSGCNLKLEFLGFYPEGLVGVSGARLVREVAKSSQHLLSLNMLFPIECCGGKNNTEYSRENESIGLADGCIKEPVEEDEWAEYGNPHNDPFSCEKMKKLKSHYTCLFDCLMRDQGVFGDDGTEDIEKWEDFITKFLAFPWLKRLASTAFKKCIASKDNSWLEDGKSLECSPRALDVNDCVWSQVIMTCPEEHFVESAYCKHVKEAIGDLDG